jgi:hypothetical protein
MLFVFQACYGQPGDFGNDVRLSGTVRSKSTGLPIQGIKINFDDEDLFNSTVTDEDGKFNFYVYIKSNGDIPLVIRDIDGDENGRFRNQEIVVDSRGQDEVIIHVELEELDGR